MTRGRISKSDSNNVINGIVQLKTEFKRTSGQSTFVHKQIYHKDGWYIYQVGPYNYEVFMEKITNGITIKDGCIKTDDSIKKVKYPNDEDFGNWAWSVTSIDDAMKYIEHYS